MIKNKIKILLIFFLILQIYVTFAQDKEYILTPTNNTQNNVYFSTWSTIQTKYYNKDNNSDIVWNYLSGSYYSTIYWYFDFIDVRFVGSTSKCSSWYGYKLDGKAYSESVWYIDFWYNSNTFVYYCMNDKKLYWKAYMQAIWEQIFDWITFEILWDINSSSYTPSKDTIFVNNTTIIFSNTPEITWKKYWQESIFYIWKPKKK